MADPITICLTLGSLILDLGTAEILLRWTHSVQKTGWTERWQATEAGLVALEATVEGSGAGMEPGEGAVRTPEGWSWRPDLPPQPDLIFARSDATADWRICRDDRCATVGDLTNVAAPSPPFHLAPCRKR